MVWLQSSPCTDIPENPEVQDVAEETVIEVGSCGDQYSREGRPINQIWSDGSTY